jgi:hypothetical protein
MCNTIYIVPGGDTADRPSAAPDATWYMRTPERQVYGPVSRPELERWLAEGRISAECELRTREDAPWRRADEYFGILSPRPEPQRQTSGQNPFAERGPDQPMRATAQGAAVGGASAAARYQVPHRGGLILVLGILSWVFGCPVLSVMAWMMGNSDLREMRAGRMDSSGMGLTQAGHILGMIHALLWLIACAIGLFVMLIAIAAEGF